MSDEHTLLDATHAAQFAPLLSRLRAASVVSAELYFYGQGDEGALDGVTFLDERGDPLCVSEDIPEELFSSVEEVGVEVFDALDAWSVISDNDGGDASLVLNAATGELSVEVRCRERDASKPTGVTFDLSGADVSDADAHRAAVLDVLADLGAVRMTAYFAGQGDEGQVDECAVEREDGTFIGLDEPTTLTEATAETLGLNADEPPTLRDLLDTLNDDLVYLPNVDWVNNDGGFGTVTVDVVKRTIAVEASANTFDSVVWASGRVSVAPTGPTESDLTAPTGP